MASRSSPVVPPQTPCGSRYDKLSSKHSAATAQLEQMALHRRIVTGSRAYQSIEVAVPWQAARRAQCVWAGPRPPLRIRAPAAVGEALVNGRTWAPCGRAALGQRQEVGTPGVIGPACPFFST